MPVHTPLLAACAALLLGPVAVAAGQAQAPPAAPGAPAATVPAPVEPHRRTVPAQLDALLASGLLTLAAHDRARDGYAAARTTLGRLSGRRRVELRAVLATLDAVTRRGGLSSARVPLAFETLERNRQWWSTGALLPYGARIGFPGSELVWQSYPGQGIQVQWLGTWAKANALWTGRTYDARLRALVAEATAFAAPRAGGIAWESWFTFDGGRPPWVSGLAQGTALQALSRAAVRLGEAALLTTAHAALGIFGTPPPEGVRVATAVGAHYLQYSFAPRLRIFNGFAQALNGLFDYAGATGDPEGQERFAAGDAELRRELPLADTGAWSRYSVGGAESDLGYHRLLRDVLLGLCTRTGPGAYCDTAARFTADEHRPPVLALRPATGPAARVGRTARVAFSLDKVASVALVVRRDGVPVFTSTVRFARGRHAFALPRLRHSGPLALQLRAVDLAGNASAASGVLAVAPRARRPGADDAP